MSDFRSPKELRIQTWCPVLYTFAWVKLSDLQMAASGVCPCHLNKREGKQLKINYKEKFFKHNLSSRSSSFVKSCKMW